MDERIIAALIGSSVTAILLTAKELLQARSAARREQRRFAGALAAEISYNIRDLEQFLADSVSMDMVRRLIETTGAPPHVTDAKHTRIYDQSVERLFAFDAGTITEIVEFYSHLDKLQNQIAGLQLPSFRGISEGGKIATVEYIFTVAGDAIALGRDAEAAVTREIEQLKWRPWPRRR